MTTDALTAPTHNRLFFIDRLPIELAEAILAFIDPSTVLKTQAVCRQWQREPILETIQKKIRRDASIRLFGPNMVSGFMAEGTPIGELPLVLIEENRDLKNLRKLPSKVQRVVNVGGRNADGGRFRTNILAFRIREKGLMHSDEGVYRIYQCRGPTSCWHPDNQPSEVGKKLEFRLSQRHIEAGHLGKYFMCEQCLTPLLKGEDPEFVLVEQEKGSHCLRSVEIAWGTAALGAVAAIAAKIYWKG